MKPTPLQNLLDRAVVGASVADAARGALPEKLTALWVSDLLHRGKRPETQLL
jgi:hypothetical protein